uniref:Uncharacterized protein n=1 Tax=Chlorocebus sabaeus TaxID=60711 RepID=A0A0D9SBA5_CHLSB
LQFGCASGLQQNWLGWLHNFPSNNITICFCTFSH